jgi:hypothetical protein
MTAVHRTKWFLPLFSLATGLAMLAALSLGGRQGDGLFALGLMTAIGLVALLGGRSDLIRGLRGDGKDEYWERLDLRATALAGGVVIAAVCALCLWEWAHGRDGSPYAAIGALGGVSYVLALGVLRWRG